MEGDYFETGCRKFKSFSNTAKIRLGILKIFEYESHLIEYIGSTNF